MISRVFRGLGFLDLVRGRGISDLRRRRRRERYEREKKESGVGRKRGKGGVLGSGRVRESG